MTVVHRLIFKLAIFILPILLVLAFPIYVMAQAGEFISTQRIIELEEKNDRPYMICPAYNDPWGYVKLKSAQNRGAEVLALGTSRVMMIRQTFFRVPFYNGSRGVSEMKHFRMFLEALPEKVRPKILIIGLDPNFLNPGWVWSSSVPIYYEPPRYSEWLTVLGKKWKQVYLDLARKAFDFGTLLKKDHGIQKIGLLAKAKNNGFLNDGSYLYQDFFDKQHAGVYDSPDKKFAKDLKNVQDGADVYVPASRISEKSFEELERFLEEARQMNVHVIGYVPPYAPAVYEALQSKHETYSFGDQFETVFKPLFQKYGFNFFDFQNPELLSAVNDEFHDGQHDGGEVTARLLKEMAKEDPFLEKAISHEIPPSDFIPGLGILASSDSLSEKSTYE
jgi:hypothetical protein